MSVSNDLVEGSTFLNPVVPISNGDDFPSLEDQAWADSCFVGDSEISSSDWDSFKNALQEINISPVSEISSVERTDDNASSNDGDEEEDADGDMELYKTIKSKSKKHNGVSPFRPNYIEHLQKNENPYLGLDFDFFDFSEDQLAKDIFKVWDFDFPTEEEDELVSKHLILESSIEKIPATFNDLEALKDMKDGSLDDLINGISDLALDM